LNKTQDFTDEDGLKQEEWGFNRAKALYMLQKSYDLDG